MRQALSLFLMLAMLPLAGARAQTIPVDGLNLHVPVKSLRATRLGGMIQQQYDFSCGSAALATLLSNHYGHPITEESVLRAMFAAGDQQKIAREGFSMLDMKRYLEGQGYAADGFRQSLDKLAEARLPAIVLVDEGGYHHFVVVKGLAGDRVLVGDPARGIRTVPRAAFEKSWIGGLLFVIHNHTEEARFNLAADWRAAPRAPLVSGVARDRVPGLDLPKLSPGDY